jgi:cyclin L
MGAVFLASKLMEVPKRVREVATVFNYLKEVVFHPAATLQSQSPPPNHLNPSSHDIGLLSYVGEDYYDLRDRVTFAENVILRELGFHLEVNLPYGLLINYCQVLGLLSTEEQSPPSKSLKNTSQLESDLKVTQKALGYLNDSFFTCVHMLFQPHVIACAAISLACKDENSVLPMNPPWFQVFDTFERELLVVEAILLSAYQFHALLSCFSLMPPPLTQLEFKLFIQKKFEENGLNRPSAAKSK